MKALLPLLIIQIFGIALNIPAKELPLYGEVEINDKENFFLKSDLFKIGKRSNLLFIFLLQNFSHIIHSFMLIIAFQTKTKIILV